MSEFDPSKYLTKLQGKDYLEVRWRLVWAQETNERLSIDTDHISIDDTLAIFKATVCVLDADGAVIKRATGYGSETPKDFRDYIEKAETKAIGRALGAIGYGTQFTNDFDEGVERTTGQQNIVDSPVARTQAEPHRPAAKSNYPPPAANRVSNGNNGPTPSQRNFMNGLAKDLGWVMVGQDGGTHHNPDEMDLEVSQLYPGKTVDTLTVSEASALIDQWKQKKAELVANPRD
jgi:hypothetical protein